MSEMNRHDVLMKALGDRSRDRMVEYVTISAAEGRKTAAAQMQVMKLHELRSRKNILRKQMDSVLSDAMTILKKTGEKIRSPGG